MMRLASPPAAATGLVKCPSCTHSVEGRIVTSPSHRRPIAAPGQKCPRCASSLDAAAVLRVDRAA